MELDATTFALEVLNFLVLLWLLRRFLYRPVQAALAARAEAAARATEDLAQRGRALDERAAALERQGAELAARRDAAQRELADEIAAQRQKQLDALHAELGAERETARARLAQEQLGARQQSDRELRQRAAAFVADYLRRLATPALEAAVMALFLDDLERRSDAARAALRDESAGEAPPIDVCTAFAPPAALRERIDAEIATLLGRPARTAWRLDPALLAGVCVHLPGHQLEASLRQGIDAFAATPAVA